MFPTSSHNVYHIWFLLPLAVLTIFDFYFLLQCLPYLIATSPHSVYHIWFLLPLTVFTIYLIPTSSHNCLSHLIPTSSHSVYHIWFLLPLTVFIIFDSYFLLQCLPYVSYLLTFTILFHIYLLPTSAHSVYYNIVCYLHFLMIFTISVSYVLPLTLFTIFVSYLLTYMRLYYYGFLVNEGIDIISAIHTFYPSGHSVLYYQDDYPNSSIVWSTTFHFNRLKSH